MVKFARAIRLAQQDGGSADDPSQLGNPNDPAAIGAARFITDPIGQHPPLQIGVGPGFPGQQTPVSGPGDWWHGSASGDLRGGQNGLHLGTHTAATTALEAQIGIPADGMGWRGDREYGTTLLAGRNSIASGKFGPYRETGFNAGGQNVEFPAEDFYAREYFDQYPKQWPTYSNGERMPLSVKPSVEPYRIVGKMNNTVDAPYEDFKANGYMRSALKRGNARNGYFYRNISEDPGSISAVVPRGSHVEKRMKGGRVSFAKAVRLAKGNVL
jgi:hypothetical protein